MHYGRVCWTVLFHDAFEDEFNDLSEAVQDEVLAQGKLLEMFGPTLGRPRVDTLKGVAFAFDPKRRCVLLVAGDKSGGSEKRFYRSLLQAADARFDAHVARLKKENQR